MTPLGVCRIPPEPAHAAPQSPLPAPVALSTTGHSAVESALLQVHSIQSIYCYPPVAPERGYAPMLAPLAPALVAAAHEMLTVPVLPEPSLYASFPKSTASFRLGEALGEAARHHAEGLLVTVVEETPHEFNGDAPVLSLRMDLLKVSDASMVWSGNVVSELPVPVDAGDLAGREMIDTLGTSSRKLLTSLQTAVP